MTTHPRRVVGLVPAAGYARRLGSLPCSKEIYPIGADTVAHGKRGRPKAVGHYLLEKMRYAGIGEALIVVRDGKWDILEYFKDGALVGMRLGYLLATVPWGVPYTLDQAYPFVCDTNVALGFPDIVFSSNDAFERVITHQAKSRADVALGLFPADRPSTMDVVELDPVGRVISILSKPMQTTLTQTWGLAVWAPSFTQFLHDYLFRRPTPEKQQPELSIGNVIQAGIVEGGIVVEGISVSTEPFLDIGIPENLERILNRQTDS
jgi:glucose-1-phosphate thymidylyltransferase